MKKMTIKEMADQYNEMIDEMYKWTDTNVPAPIKKFPTKLDGERRLLKLRDQIRLARKEYNQRNCNFKGRKMEVYEVLVKGPTTTEDLSIQIGISRRNISSILTYLRREGLAIETKNNGKECKVELHRTPAIIKSSM